MSRYFFVLLVLLTACSSNNSTNVKSKVLEQVSIVDRVQKVVLYPGKVTYLEFPINLKDGRWFLFCKDTEVPFLVRNNLAKVYLSETYFSSLEQFKCRLEIDEKDNDSQEVFVLDVEVIPFEYKSERLYVDQKRVVLSKKDEERVMREKEITRKVYLNSASYYLFDTPFMIPLDSYITSHYGTKRLFNNEKNSSHLGNDFRAKVGVPIPVSNKGRVVYIGDLFYSGKTVIVDHGMNIFTLYGHLSTISVTKGSLINRGDIVGLSGRTGRVSGPHLHWGVRVNGHQIDGISLVSESIKHLADTKIVENKQ